MSEAQPDPYAPDHTAQRAILLFAIVSGLLLLIAHEALSDQAAWFASRSLRGLWFTLAIAPPLMAALTVQRLPDHRFIGSLASYTALLAYTGLYAGTAMQPDRVEVWAVANPYVLVLVASGHVTSAWLAVWLSRGSFSYPQLFDAAWRQVSSLLQVLAYTGAFWLLLLLWGALFKALGIGFFEELFQTPRFAYPVSSLVAGYGLVLARTRSSLSDAVHLRILALWRGLLPLAALLALAFAAAVLVKGVEPLWQTRHATQLLLALILALVTLTNAAYGKGEEAPPHPLLKRLVQSALLLLPLFTLLAAWALSLRWRQYGLSLDRLWAALCIAIASFYALGYALAAARPSQPWLAGIAGVNRLASLLMAAALLLTQTGALDFRAITAHALLARGDALKADDLRYLRWELGHPGLYALERLQVQRAAQSPKSAAAIGRLLARKARYGSHEEPETAATLSPPPYRQPAGAAPPPTALLLALAKAPATENRADELDEETTPAQWLFELELSGAAPKEWLRIALPATAKKQGGGEVELDLFQSTASGWQRVRNESQWLNPSDQLAAALEAGQVSVEPPAFFDLRVGAQSFSFPKNP